MTGTHVLVRLPSQGTLFGEAVARHAGARVNAIVAGKRRLLGHEVVDHVAFVEGLPDAVLARILLAWPQRYGQDPQALGGPFALRLPITADGPHDPIMAAMLRVGEEAPGVAVRCEGDRADFWVPCRDEAEAAWRAQRLEAALAEVPEVSIATGEPTRDDRDCWGLLQLAAEWLTAAA